MLALTGRADVPQYMPKAAAPERVAVPRRTYRPSPVGSRTSDWFSG